MRFIPFLTISTERVAGLGGDLGEPPGLKEGGVERPSFLGKQVMGAMGRA